MNLGRCQFAATGQNFRMGYFSESEMADDNCYSYQLNGHLGTPEPNNLSKTNFLQSFATKLSTIDHKMQFSISCAFPYDPKKRFENHKKPFPPAKPNIFTRDSFENWKNMNRVYSHVLGEPKGFSSLSCPISSYLVGGFVGSKSQMNNEKHKLSFDLGGFIFHLLNGKWDKAEEKITKDKSNGNDSCVGNSKIQSDRKYKFEAEASSHVKDKLKELVPDNSANFGSVINIPNEPNESSKAPKSLSSINTEKMCNLKNNCSGKCDTEVRVSDDYLANTTKCPSQSSASQNKVDSSMSTKEDLGGSKGCLLVGCHLESVKSSDHGTEATKTTQTPSDYCPISNFLSQCKSRFRMQSECSIDSTDSESYILFDDQLCEQTDGDCRSFQFLCDDEEYSSDEDYEEYTEICFDHAVPEANARWTQMYSDVHIEKEAERKVRFNDKVDVHLMVVWNFAYRAARLGPWEQMARDRERFRDRISRVESTLSPILRENHREKVLRSLSCPS